MLTQSFGAEIGDGERQQALKPDSFQRLYGTTESRALLQSYRNRDAL